MPFPLIPLITGALSLISSARAKKKANDDEKQAEDSLNNAPKYSPNRSILNFYDEALRKYETNPTDTREYKATQQGIKQGVVQGLNALRDRRSGLAGTPALITSQNNALLNAAVKSEQKKAQEFGVLGQASQMKAGEDNKAFQQNEIYPFEGKYNLLTLKTAGNRAVQRQETQNAYNNLSAAAGLNDGLDSQLKTQNNFGKTYGSQGSGAYNWAKANNMNFGQYKRQGNRVGRSLMNWGY